MAGGSGGLLVLKEIQLSLLKIIIVAKLFSFVLGKPIYYQRRASIDCCSKIAHPWPTANLILQCDNKWIKFGSFSFRPHLYLFFVPPGFFSSSFFSSSIFAKVVCHYLENWIYSSLPDHFRYTIFISVFVICVVCSCSFHDVHNTRAHIWICCLLCTHCIC